MFLLGNDFFIYLFFFIRSTYTRNIVRPAAPTHGSNVRSRTQDSNSALTSVYTSKPRDTDSLIRLRPQVNTGSSIQALDNGGDSLDAQFGTNPRSISLPDKPYRLNSYESNSDMRKAERSQQQLTKPKVTSTRYSSPARPAYKTGRVECTVSTLELQILVYKCSVMQNDS